MAHRLGEAIAGARVETLERCGHWTPIERPKECARLTAGFLQTHMI
jgi:pimeloyl-ACP methyl ester carboxylesterase